MNEPSPFVPLIQPAQAIVGSSNLTGVDLDPIWTLDCRRSPSSRSVRHVSERTAGPAARSPVSHPRGRQRSCRPAGFLVHSGAGSPRSCSSPRHHPDRVRAHPARAGRPGARATSGQHPTQAQSTRSTSATGSTSRCRSSTGTTCAAPPARRPRAVSQQTHNPVRTDLGSSCRRPPSWRSSPIFIAVLVGVGFGLVAALRRDRPTDHVLRVVSLAGDLDADVLARAGRALRLLLPAGLVPRRRPARPGRRRPAAHHRHVHGRRAAGRPVATASGTRCSTSCCRRSCSPRTTSACSRATRARPCSR